MTENANNIPPERSTGDAIETGATEALQQDSAPEQRSTVVASVPEITVDNMHNTMTEADVPHQTFAHLDDTQLAQACKVSEQTCQGFSQYVNTVQKLYDRAVENHKLYG